MTSLRIRPLACFAALAFGLAGSAFAQSAADSFPTKPIYLIVPYAAGGGTDLVMRAIAPGMAEALGQPIVVENKPGGVRHDEVNRLGGKAVSRALGEGGTG